MTCGQVRALRKYLKQIYRLHQIFDDHNIESSIKITQFQKAFQFFQNMRNEINTMNQNFITEIKKK